MLQSSSSNLCQLVEQDFGLHVLTVLQPMTKELALELRAYRFFRPDFWQLPDGSPPDRSDCRMLVPLSYLMLPDELTRNATSIHRVEDRVKATGKPKLDMTSFTIFDPDMLHLAEEKKQLFRRFLNFFGLGPFINPACAVSLQAHHKRKLNSYSPQHQSKNGLAIYDEIIRLKEGT